MSFRLAIQDGRFARTLEVREDVTVGTHSACGLRLEAAGVARRHARLRQYGRRVVAEDLGGRTGLHVAGRRVRRVALAAGDDVRIGDASLRVLDVLPDPGAAVARRSARGRQTGRPVRAGPFAVSLALHAALLTLLWGWVISAGRPPSEPARFQVSSPLPGPDVPETPDEPLTDPLTVTPRDVPDVDLVPPDEEPPDTPLVDDDPRMQPPPRLDPSPEPSPVEDPPEPVTATIGVGGGAAAAIPARSFAKGEAGDANRAAAGIVEGDPGGGAALRGIRGRASAANVWVIRGDYDSAEKVLAELQVTCAVLGKDDLETRAIPPSVRVLVYNCTGRALSPEAQNRIAWWTHQGGWVVTTDWGVERLLERGFPGTIAPLRVNDRPVLTKDETVGVRATTSRGLDAGLPTDGVARWWLEDSSVPFTITPGIGAEVLVRSDDLERRLGSGAGAVAVTFAYGKGRVLHLLGHVYQQEGNLRGAVIVQRLIVNYLAGALGD